MRAGARRTVGFSLVFDDTVDPEQGPDLWVVLSLIHASSLTDPNVENDGAIGVDPRRSVSGRQTDALRNAPRWTRSGPWPSTAGRSTRSSASPRWGEASIRRGPDCTVPRCRSRELGEGREREHDAREDGEGNEDLAYDAAIHGGPVENVGESCDRSTASSLRPRTDGDPNNSKIV